MDSHPSSDSDLIARLQAYQAASNRHDIDAALAMFTADACIEVADQHYCGMAALRAAHEYDWASRTQITFGDFEVNGDTVACQAVYCDELDPAVALDGLQRRAVFTFRDGRIHKFVSFPPDEVERERHRRAKRAFYRWAQANYPEKVSTGFTCDDASGASLFKVVQAWRAAQVLDRRSAQGCTHSACNTPCSRRSSRP